MNHGQLFAGSFAVLLAASLTTAPVSAACAFTNTVALSFPVYDVSSTSDDNGTGAFTISCTANASAMISLSAGGGGSFSPRTMVGPATSVLSYNLYSDASRTTIWGDGTGGSASVTRALSAGVPLTFTVYARIFRGQAGVTAGQYSDSVMVTVAP